MKNYEQMAADVLRRRDEAVAEVAEKRKTTRRVAMIAAAGLLTVGVTAGIGSGLISPMSDGGHGKVTAEIGGTTRPTPEIQTNAPAGGAFWDDLRERKDIHYTISESAIEWGWEDMTDSERYANLDHDGTTYRMNGTVANYLGEWLASGEAYGFAWDQNNARYGISCEIYALTFSPDHSVVAVQLEGSNEIYRFEREREYDPPKTLGEFIDSRKLPEILPLTTLYYNRWEWGNAVSDKYSLSDDHSRAVWDMLAKYGDAPLAEEYKYYGNDEDVGFSATSEVLGIRNRSFRVNAEGYIVTNVEDYGYCYFIGVDAAREIIDYVKANMTDPLPEEAAPVYHIVGTVTEIGNGYIKVDDSIMMKNPEEGLTFTVDVTDKRLSRVVDLLVGVGDHVLISYDGRISEGGTLLVETATSIQEVWIDTNGSVLIPE